jgi:hypothetical protein
MKKYFAKWLPVEGEIKSGDLAIDAQIAPKQGLTYQGGDQWLNSFGDTVTLPQWKTRFHFVKQKLFLCSYDIQIGDEMIIDIPSIPSHGEKRICKHVLPPATIIGETEPTYHLNDTGAHLKHGECFKVIGEISPDALSYVQEGDEFDYEELRIRAEFGPWPLVRIDDPKYQHGLKDDLTIAVKGPCGHFH